MKRKPRPSRRRRVEIRDYDLQDTSDMIDPTKPLTLKQIGIELPRVPPTQVVSIRLPSTLLNELKAYASQRDIPYQALIKLLLAESLRRRRAA
jgi:predicted DNA binding CopG/RHH family protein